VKSTNLRNKPVDKRRLSAQDKESYRSGNRSKALSKARQRKGQMAWDNKVQTGTQEHKPGSGGLSMGRNTQGQRQAQESAKIARSKTLRAEKPIY
jgi:hypothetical protein